MNAPAASDTIGTPEGLILTLAHEMDAAGHEPRRDWTTILDNLAHTMDEP